MRLRFERPDDGRIISRDVASLNILAHDVINVLHNDFTEWLRYVTGPIKKEKTISNVLI